MEIGSEYWEIDEELNKNNLEYWNIGQDVRFTLSGRTSIYYVLKNILNTNKIKSVYMPSYCCDSMIQAFEDLEIEVKYYDVYYNEGLKYNIDLTEDFDLFFAMNYFGYSKTNMETYIKKCKQAGKIVIEDITHSILSKKRFSEYSDYLVGSLRKWFPVVSGGIAVARYCNFELDLKPESNSKMIDVKMQAMKYKREYIQENIQTKEKYLNNYTESNKILYDDYKNYSIDEKSYDIIMKIDIDKIKNIRNENIKIIYEKLKNNIHIKFLLEDFEEEDTLLFVPILLEKKIRNELREYLIEQSVFLPIHWQLDEKINNIFDNELSLVCDQRYTVEQIESYIDLIIEYLMHKG